MKRGDTITVRLAGNGDYNYLVTRHGRILARGVETTARDAFDMGLGYSSEADLKGDEPHSVPERTTSP